MTTSMVAAHSSWLPMVYLADSERVRRLLRPALDPPHSAASPTVPALIGSGSPQTGITLGAETGWFGALRWRFFGARPLIEDGSIYSSPTSIFNARMGYAFENGLKLQADVFNLLNAQASQIDYFYTSRLPGEPAAGIADRHFHLVEPQMVRFTLTKAF